MLVLVCVCVSHTPSVEVREHLLEVSLHSKTSTHQDLTGPVSTNSITLEGGTMWLPLAGESQLAENVLYIVVKP